MTTDKQKQGARGEILVTRNSDCPQCKRRRTLRRLPANFKCADVICDFCGYLAQVKTARTQKLDQLPNSILGAAWSVQEERMAAGIYFPLYLVMINSRGNHSIFYLPSDLQSPEMFIPRKPLADTARRAGWQGFRYDLSNVKDRFVRLS